MVSRNRSAGVLCVLVALFAPFFAQADEIVVKGDRLRGTVVNVTTTAIEFETLYGKGKIEIPLGDVESVTTEGTYVVIHGETETRGRIVGVEEGVILIGDSPDGAERVEAESVQLVLSETAIDESPLVAAKRKLRYWSGNLDLGFGLSQGTVDTRAASLDATAERRKGPTRFLTNLGLFYGKQKDQEGQSLTTADQYYGQARYEYDLLERLFAYGNGYAEYNGVQRLSVRGIPEAGMGYKLWLPDDKDSDDFLAATAGGSWVYERFFGGMDEDYFAVAFGLEALFTLPYDATITGSVSYLPSVSDFANDFLIRSKAELAIPVWEQLSFNFAIADDYDNTPAPGTTFNYLTTTVGLSLGL